MINTQALKQLLKKPLENGDNLTESIGQFLTGVFDAGKVMGFKEGYQQGYEDGKEDEHEESRRPLGK